MPSESLNFSIGADTKAFQAGMEGCLKALAGLSAAMAAVHLVTEEFGKALDLGGRLTDLSNRTGELAGNLYLLEHAFGKNGIAAEKTGATLNRLQKFVGDAADGSAEANKTLADLGLTVADLAGKLPIEQMAVIAGRIAQIQDPTQRASAAMGVFGKSGGELIPILRNFSDEMRIAKEETGSMSQILNKSAGDLDAMGERLEGFGKAKEQFFTGFSAQVAGAFNDAFAEIKVDWAGVGDFIGDTFAHGSVWGGMRQWQKYFGESVTISHEIAAALEPIVQVGQKFSGEMTTAAEKLEIALGKASLLDVLTRPQEKPWGDNGGGGMLDIANHDPNALVDFSDANARARAMAQFERWRRVREMRDEEYRKRQKEEGGGFVGSMGGGYASPSVYGGQQLFGDRVRRQPRANKVTGAGYENSFKSSTELTTDDVIDALNPFGAAARKMAGTKGKQSAAEGQKAKQQAASKASRTQADPMVEMVSLLRNVDRNVAKIEQKLPQQIAG